MTAAGGGTFRAPAADTQLPHLGTYRRTLPVRFARLEETVLDVERLPYLHASNYSWVHCEDRGDWGWRARAGLPVRDGIEESLLELRFNREEARWVLRHLEGVSAGAEVWSHAVIHGAQSLSVIVDFFVPGIAAASRGQLGEAYARTYHALYDADEAMMVEREAALADILLAPAPAADVIEAEGERLRVVELSDGLWAFPARCPHRLASLEVARVEDGVVTCPWHGRRFDVRSGRCVDRDDCALAPARRVQRTPTGVRFC